MSASKQRAVRQILGTRGEKKNIMLDHLKLTYYNNNKYDLQTQV